MSIRTERVSALIKNEIGNIIETHLQFGVSGLLTVTSVIVTPDLKIAKIYISIFNQEGTKEEVINKLNFNKSKIRFMLGKQVVLKFLPELVFYVDETQDKIDKLEKIFQQIHQDDNKK
jgi:ribosome-binding factor A